MEEEKKCEVNFFLSVVDKWRKSRIVHYQNLYLPHGV